MVVSADWLQSKRVSVVIVFKVSKRTDQGPGNVVVFMNGVGGMGREALNERRKTIKMD